VTSPDQNLDQSKVNLCDPFVELVDFRQYIATKVLTGDSIIRFPGAVPGLHCGLVAVVAACVLLIASCSAPEEQEPIGEDIPDEPLFILLDAYRGNERYFLRYRRDDEIFYVSGDLRTQFPSADAEEASYDIPTVAPMEALPRDPWERITSQLRPVPILQVAEWGELRSRLFGELMPTESNQGLAVSFDRVDYFFFYDRDGTFRARRLIDKPPWYSVAASIDLRAYIFDNDDVALNIAELLRRRSREGIRVRVLFDGLGTTTAHLGDPDEMPEEHRSPVSMRQFLEQNSRVNVRVVKNPFMTGDHVKTMIVDRELAFVGGMNIGREYRYEWHDLMVEVTGPVVDKINREFRQAWGHAGPWGDFSWFSNWAAFDRNARRNPGGYPVRVIVTKPGREEIFRLHHEAIRRSRRYIYIQNAYFTDDHLLDELIKARRRGVDVRVIIPLETDSGFLTRNIALAANTMLANGIRVFIYPGFSHAKAAIFDGWASVGSANPDHLSLRINKELNIATSEPEAVMALDEQLFQPDFAKSTEMTEPFRERLSDHLIELFGDYLF
jgi:hypothetical protein